MKLISTLIALVPLLSIASGERYGNAVHTTCQLYYEDKSIGWKDQGYLNQDDQKTGMISKWDYKTILVNRDNGYSTYWYGIYGGVVNGTAFYAQVDRKGKGQGQQFKFDYKRADWSNIASFWMTPGKYCEAPLPAGINSWDVKSIQVWSRLNSS